jgi:hypothetical protein
MTKKEQSVIETEVKNLAVAVENLTEAVQNISYYLKGDGGHSIGDSLEGIMLQLLQEKK